MKETTVNDIHAEEVEFLGKELHHKAFKNEFCGLENMRAELLTATPYLDWVVGASYATFSTWDCSCCSPLSNWSVREHEEHLLHMLKKRPISVATESAKFTFRLTGVSRAITHQIVRHRQMAFGQQSLRVSDPGWDPIRLPPSLVEGTNTRLQDKTLKVLEQLKPLYYELIEGGVPPEQARAVLPIGITTKIVVTLTLRDMVAYFKARTSTIAQGEHTHLVHLMMEELQRKNSQFFQVTMALMGGGK